MTQQDVAAFVSDLRAAMDELQVDMLSWQKCASLCLSCMDRRATVFGTFCDLTRTDELVRHCRCRQLRWWTALPSVAVLSWPSPATSVLQARPASVYVVQ